jgi:phosphatidylglycerophosphatase A
MSNRIQEPIGFNLGRALLYTFATFGGTGYTPLAPATAASLVVALLWGLVAPVPLIWQALLVVVVVSLGIPTATHFEKKHGSDPKLVVCDEVAGMLVTYFGVSTGPLGWAAGFLWFRFFDILKPFGIRRCERWPGGWGIVGDDLLAGLYAQIFLRGTLYLTGW